LRHRKIRRRLAENLVRLAQFAILPFKGLHLLGHLGRDAGALAAVDFGLLDPVVQRLRGAADLRRNRHDRLPARRVLTLVVENQPHRALAHFRGKLVRRLAHDAPSYSGVGASGKPGAVHTNYAPPRRGTTGNSKLNVYFFSVKNLETQSRGTA